MYVAFQCAPRALVHAVEVCAPDVPEIMCPQESFLEMGSTIIGAEIFLEPSLEIVGAEIFFGIFSRVSRISHVIIQNSASTRWPLNC